MFLKIFSFWFVMATFASPLFAGSDKALQTMLPVAVVPELSYEFPPVVEGEVILHDFVMQNRGEAVLNILDVKTA